MTFLLEDRQGERGVLRGDFAAVVESRLRPQREPICQLVRRNPHRPRDQAVHCVRLVAGAHHQRREGLIHADRAIPLEDKAVQRVEGKERLIVGARRRNGREHAALRCADIDVIEVLEVRRIFQIAEGRHAVAIGGGVDAGLGHGRQRRPRRSHRAAAKDQNPPPRKAAQERLPILSAFSLSNHQSVGRPERPYFGSGAWLKRSQRA